MEKFYTDPLAAAIMTKEFGVEFANSIRDIHEDCQRNLEMMWGKTIISGSLELQRGQIYKKYYIHPDSLPIFEPQVGDFVSTNCDRILKIDEYKSADWYNENFGIKEALAAGKIKEPMRDEYILITEPLSRIALHRESIDKIIQRQGKPFFTPQEE